MLYSILAVAVLLLALYGLAFWWWLRKYGGAALVVVHPWNLGMTREEMDLIFRAMQIKFGTKTSPDERDQVFARYQEYMSQLERLLKQHRYRHIVLLDEDFRAERSYRELVELTAKWWRPMCTVVEVKTHFGRSAPFKCSWQELLGRLFSLGIKKLDIVGTILGKYQGELVDPKDRYFCVNDAVFQAVESALFTRVQLLEEFCFTEVVYTTKVPKAARAKDYPSGSQTNSPKKRSGRNKKKRK